MVLNEKLATPKQVPVAILAELKVHTVSLHQLYLDFQPLLVKQVPLQT
jgi:hypothetical protein